MKNFIELIDSFIEGKIDFEEFDKNWQKLYIGSLDKGGLYETLSDIETDFIDEIHDKEDFTTKDEKELEDLKKYNFISVNEFIEWLKEFKQKNIQLWS
ncbi:hypothetical protein KC842_01275 [Candidatus Nomurabacteria bacterium]|nr:hypothetical protein [Candidatus Nomurabacteria bacterium]USN94576.1 MAG: hypothetical protein H6791_02340 [Candidatus Nomurabacteria bacterium]